MQLRQRSHSIQKLAVKRNLLLRLWIRRRRDGGIDGQHIVWIESRIDLAQRPEAADHQSSADQQHQGKRDFTHNQCAASAAGGRV